MIPFLDSSDALDDDAALSARFHQDGYLFVRGAVDTGLLLGLREQIMAICEAHGWFAPGTDPMDGVTVIPPCVEGEQAYFDVYDEIQALEAFHAVPHHPSVRACLVPVLDESAFPHPLAIARLVFPDYEVWSTPPHQDYPNNQGTRDLYACWMPLGDCPVELGSLSVLRGSHRVGLAARDFSLGAGLRAACLDERFDGLDWVGGDFGLGDALVFHSQTVHRALPNTTKRLRLSVDYRFQREGEPLTEGCLRPHFARLTWDEIYRDWARAEHQYFWRDKEFAVTPWDESYQVLSDEQLARASRLLVEEKLRRDRLGIPCTPFPIRKRK